MKFKIFIILCLVLTFSARILISLKIYKERIRNGEMSAEQLQPGLYVESDEIGEVTEKFITFAESVDWGVLPPTTAIVFHSDEDSEIGRLTWDKGVFEFEGRAKESAHIFFEHVLKPLVDEYIAKELKKK